MRDVVSSSWSVLAISGAYRCDERYKKSEIQHILQLKIEKKNP